ncbi:alanine racemase [Spongiivirga citrea]|uniref:Alanine racemase n=1 Tax=Spongiivirga citrea TaxID=1481457 RepID=A0A6M0CMN5_9FLAO|nr:alanine racemase [Spongiivirga citrea]NER17284.1 alanine racemase [Spongiivirga citrea]
MAAAQETVLQIDLNAMAHNYRFIRSLLKPETKLLAVVKAFGYGSDAAEVAKFLEELGADYLAVAYTNEGVALRNAGIETPILVLHPQPINFKEIIDRCLEPSLYSPRILRAFAKVAKDQNQKNYPVHIKFNTGLNRLGFWENDVDFIVEVLKPAPELKVKSIFSHLAASEDENEREFTLGQISNFKKIASEIKSKLGYEMMMHQLNSSGVLNYPEAQFDMVRCGISLYGYGNDPKFNKELKPVASLRSVISQIHMIEPNETVGYNRAYVSKGYEKTATIPIGHADGISRNFGNEKGFVIINNQKASIIGNVCMDMIMVNISGIDCKEGDEVIIFDKDHTAEDAANLIGTISYELLTMVSQRVKRTFLR